MSRVVRALAAALGVAVTGLPPSAAAQTIEVRSGEHDGFSRLVLGIGADRQWRLEGTGRVCAGRRPRRWRRRWSSEGGTR